MCPTGGVSSGAVITQSFQNAFLFITKKKRHYLLLIVRIAQAALRRTDLGKSLVWILVVQWKGNAWVMKGQVLHYRCIGLVSKDISSTSWAFWKCGFCSESRELQNNLQRKWSLLKCMSHARLNKKLLLAHCFVNWTKRIPSPSWRG